MRPSIPHRVVVRSFFWPYSAEDIAWFLARMFRQPMSAARLKDIWIEESMGNPLLRRDRPQGGFAQNDETRLLERLAA